MAKWYTEDQVAQLVQHKTMMNLARETFGSPPKLCRAPNCVGLSPLAMSIRGRVPPHNVKRDARSARPFCREENPNFPGDREKMLYWVRAFPTPANAPGHRTRFEA
eukprot:7285477-Alexandrium_andersonii.AAC.1